MWYILKIFHAHYCSYHVTIVLDFIKTTPSNAFANEFTVAHAVARKLSLTWCV